MITLKIVNKTRDKVFFKIASQTDFTVGNCFRSENGWTIMSTSVTGIDMVGQTFHVWGTQRSARDITLVTDHNTYLQIELALAQLNMQSMMPSLEQEFLTRHKKKA